MKFLRLGVLAWLLLSGAVAHGARIEFAGVGEDNLFCRHLDGAKSCLILLIEGPIEDGDAKKLNNVIGKLVEGFAKKHMPVRVGKVHLNSPGGSLSEGMKIGRVLREKLIAAQITKDSKCYSACVFAFLGAVARFPVGPVGIHTFYSEDLFGSTDYVKASADFNRATEEAREYLIEMRIPATFLDEMFKVPPESLNILPLEESERLGVIGIDPLYRQLAKEKPESD